MEEEREGEKDGRRHTHGGGGVRETKRDREREILWVSTQTSVYSLLFNY